MSLETAAQTSPEPELVVTGPLPVNLFRCRLADSTLNFGFGAAGICLMMTIGTFPYVAPLPLLAVLLLAWPATVLVGDDGILCGPFFRRRFISHSDVAELGLVSEGRSLGIRLRGGDVIHLAGILGMGTKMAALRKSATDRRAQWGARRAEDAETARPFIDGGANAPYRGGTDPALLLALAQAPYVWPEVRMMAAARLVATINAPTRALFRDLAEATAEPRVRALFMQIAEGVEAERLLLPGRGPRPRP